jgi:hypothetical protein
MKSNGRQRKNREDRVGVLNYEGKGYCFVRRGRGFGLDERLSLSYCKERDGDREKEEVE